MESEQLRQFLRNTPPFYRKNGKVIRYNKNKQLKRIRYEDTYAEPEWMQRARISLSLPAMAEFILDDSIPCWEHYSSNSPLFLNLTPTPWDSWKKHGWGRTAWVRDLGLLEYKPAYDALREVWLHDSGNHINLEYLFDRGTWEDFERHDLPKEAFSALARLKDERILDDVKDRLKAPETLADDNLLHNYIRGIGSFRCDLAVDILLDFADLLRELHPGRMVSPDGYYSPLEKYFGVSEMSPALREVFFALENIGTEKARDALGEVVLWFSKDAMLDSAYRDQLYFRGRREEKEQELVLPEKESIFCSGMDKPAYDPF